MGNVGSSPGGTHWIRGLGFPLLPTGLLLHLLHLTVWVGGVELGHVQALVDAAGDGLEIGHQLVLDGLQVKAVLRGDQVNGQAQMTKPP